MAESLPEPQGQMDTVPTATPGVALLTGGTGFIGYHLARRLIADGWTLHAIVRPRSDPSRVAALAALPGIAIHVHDGTTESLCELFWWTGINIVFHLASLFLGQHRSADVERLITSNVQFPAQLVEAMVASGVRRLVNTGTAWQHYSGDDFDPVNLYAATKQAFEDVLEYYVRAAELRVATLLLYDTYGPQDWRPKLFTLLRQAAHSSQSLAMSPGEQILDLVYIDDVVEAFIVAARRLWDPSAKGHERFTISSGSALPLREVADLYARTSGRKLNIKWGGRSYRPREVMRPWTGGVSLPGWTPKVPLEMGLRRTVD